MPGIRRPVFFSRTKKGKRERSLSWKEEKLVLLENGFPTGIDFLSRREKACLTRSGQVVQGRHNFSLIKLHGWSAKEIPPPFRVYMRVEGERSGRVIAAVIRLGNRHWLIGGSIRNATLVCRCWLKSVPRDRVVRWRAAPPLSLLGLPPVRGLDRSRTGILDIPECPCTFVMRIVR